MKPKYVMLIILLVTLGTIISVSFTTGNRKLSIATNSLNELYHSQLVSFDSSLKEYPKYFYDSAYSTRISKFCELIYQFKQIECLYTYLHPKEAYQTFLLTPRFQQRDFGFPVPDNWIWILPFGIQTDSALKKLTVQDSIYTFKFIQRATTNFCKTLQETAFSPDAPVITESDVFDALRIQMARISTISLANGDLVIEEAGMPGLEGAFDSWSQMVKIYLLALPASENDLRNKILLILNRAENLLDSKPSFRDFDRLDFLTTQLIPLSRLLNELQQVLKIPSKQNTAAFNRKAADIYAKNALDVDYFSSEPGSNSTLAKAELGKILFFDPILSDNNQRSCASCHKAELAFSDGNKKSLGFEREKDLQRNAPTIINAVFQKHQFWDLRAATLEDQLDSVINNKDELHGSFNTIIEKINSSKEYLKLFDDAFPETNKGTITREHVRFAIAAYERTLTGLDSRFDKYARGDRSQLNSREIKGFNLFMGKAKCGTCHFAPVFNGALPPFFDSTEHRSIGVPFRDTMDIYEVDPDTGFSKINNSAFNHFSFKVPTVRNAELTAPYMHNGVYKTLDQVIDFYDHAGGTNFTKQMRPGMKGLPFFMILPEKLNLTKPEKEDLVLFMKTLTDTTAAANKPHRLPMLGGKYAELNKRKLGGDY